MFLITLNTLTT